MLLRNRKFERVEPSRDAKKIFIFCEGRKTEPNYFKYFQNIDTRIALIVVPPASDGNNSPTGLYETAEEQLLETQALGYQPKDDEVWFVIDVDAWGEKIIELENVCKGHHQWNVAKSNPCFEVWLYFHWFEQKPTAQPNNWKSFLDSQIRGGWQRRHAQRINYAIVNAEKQTSEQVAWCETSVFRLAKVFYPFIKNRLLQQQITLIAAHANNRGIGFNSAMPWRLSADLKRFKALTSGHAVIMGRKTFDSIGRPLPNRTNIVITRQPQWRAEGCLRAGSLQEAIALANSSEIFIIGGGEIYAQALPMATCLQLTLVNATPEADAFFPAFPAEEWEETHREQHCADEKNEFDYAFVTLKRKA